MNPWIVLPAIVALGVVYVMLPLGGLRPSIAHSQEVLAVAGEGGLRPGVPGEVQGGLR